MKPTETWIARYKAGTEFKAPDDERLGLNEAIKEIAFNGCNHEVPDTNNLMQRAAGLMVYLARTRVGGEPLYFVKEVCDVWEDLDIEPFLIQYQEAKEYDVD